MLLKTSLIEVIVRANGDGLEQQIAMGGYNLVNLLWTYYLLWWSWRIQGDVEVQANAALVWKERIVPNVGSGTTWFYLGYHVADWIKLKSDNSGCRPELL